MYNLANSFRNVLNFLFMNLLNSFWFEWTLGLLLSSDLFSNASDKHTIFIEICFRKNIMVNCRVALTDLAYLQHNEAFLTMISLSFPDEWTARILGDQRNILCQLSYFFPKLMQNFSFLIWGGGIAFLCVHEDWVGFLLKGNVHS